MKYHTGDLVEINDDEGRTYQATVCVKHVRIEGLDMTCVMPTTGHPTRIVVESRLVSVVA